MGHESANLRTLICPQCGGTMEIRYVGIQRDKRSACLYCRSEIDLPDDEMVVPVAQPAQYVHAAQTVKDNKLAVFSLIAGIAGLINFLPILGSIAAVVIGNKALRQIREDPNFYTGETMARAGIVLGYVGLATAMLICCFYLGMYILAALQGAIQPAG